MKQTIVAVCLVFALTAADRGDAAEFPSWALNKICAQDSDAAACKEYEALARRQVLGPWQTMPDEVTTRCLEEISSFGEYSYRLLNICLRTELYKIHQLAQKHRSA